MQILFIIIAIVIADQLTKYWAKHTLEPIGQIPLIGDWLKFTFTENIGIAFGIDLGGQVAVTVLSVLATIGISIYLYSLRRDNIYYKLAFACILGGAIGNLIDRALYGRVVDFIHFDLYRGYIGTYYLSLWPIFNVADIAISTGVGIMFVWYKRIFEPELATMPSQTPQTPEEPKIKEETKRSEV
ncbi:MAG: signal peptidase II [Chlorobiales bacterium]